MLSLGFPGGPVVKNPPANAGDVGLTPGLGRSPGVGNGNPLQYSCLGNPMDRGAWWATVHSIAKSRTRLSTHTFLAPQGVSKGFRDLNICKEGSLSGPQRPP